MRWIVLIVPFLLLNCSVDEVREVKAKKLVIASDFLTRQDADLFKSWSRKTGVKIRILTLSHTDLQEKLNEKEFNSGIDMFISNSLFTSQKLHHSKSFQHFDLENMTHYDSREYGFFALGIDPYIFEPNTDSSEVPLTYSELIKDKFHSKLKTEDEIPFLAAFLSKMDRVQTYMWLKTYVQNKDSLHLTEFTVNRLSYSKTKAKITYPGKRVSGTLYNLISCSVINQSENYTTCRSFLNHFRNERPNKFLCSKLKLIPLSNPENIRLFREKPENLLQYYSMIKRMLNQINKKAS
jgi:hypothetical protein